MKDANLRKKELRSFKVSLALFTVYFGIALYHLINGTNTIAYNIVLVMYVVTIILFLVIRHTETHRDIKKNKENLIFKTIIFVNLFRVFSLGGEIVFLFVKNKGLNPFEQIMRYFVFLLIIYSIWNFLYYGTKLFRNKKEKLEETIEDIKALDIKPIDVKNLKHKKPL